MTLRVRRRFSWLPVRASGGRLTWLTPYWAVEWFAGDHYGWPRLAAETTKAAADAKRVSLSRTYAD